MPRALRSYKRFNQTAIARQLHDPQLDATPVQTFQYKGEDKTSEISRMPQGTARLVQDLMLRYGSYASRDGLSVLGAIASAAIAHAQEIILSTGVSFPTRWKADGVEVYTGGAWVATTGTAWTTTGAKPFAMSGWGDTIVFAEDALGIYSLAFTSGYPKILLFSLLNVRHLATFAGRIVASLPDGIQWCVKYNNADWAGLGSGNESLKSSPGGRSDAQTAVIPVSNETALVIRTGSVWQMVVTGNFDAPFSFNRLYEGSGGKYPRCCVAIPGGAVWLGQDGTCWKLDMTTGRPPVDIGKPIYKQLRATPGLLGQATAMYDPRYNEFRISIPSTSTTSAVVYRYNLSGDFWTEDSYQFPIRSMSFALFAQSIAISELTGTIAQLPGLIQDLTAGFESAETMFSMADPQRYVVMENKVYNTNALRDVDYTATRVAGTLRIETAPVRKADLLHRTEILNLILEYETDLASTFHFWYSEDSGQTWILLQDVAVVPTTKPTLLTLQYALDRDQVTFALSGDGVSSLKIVDLFAMVRGGGMRTDAS